MKRLYRSRTNKKIFGVCGGLGEYFEMDPTIIRLALLLLIVFAGAGLLAYIIAALVMPIEPMA
ncbi:MAG: PspC domain-containing protein [Clostridia bacterium]|nr:PspC domain-containing protein [Clostridia bacterium]